MNGPAATTAEAAAAALAQAVYVLSMRCLLCDRSAAFFKVFFVQILVRFVAHVLVRAVVVASSCLFGVDIPTRAKLCYCQFSKLGELNKEKFTSGICGQNSTSQNIVFTHVKSLLSLII